MCKPATVKENGESNAQFLCSILEGFTVHTNTK